jgi:hypothetical protein
MSQGGEAHVHDEHGHEEHDHVEHGHQEEAQAGLSHDSAVVEGSQSGTRSCPRKQRSEMKWPTDVKSVGEVNDEGLPMDRITSTKLSRVCGLAAQQRVSLTLDTFDDLSNKDRKELFDNSVEAYVEYP